MANEKTKGARVGAISHTDEDTMYLFGYGVYDGDFVPPSEVKAFGEHFPYPNPQITLDNGKKVYGCECWWGPEEKVKTNASKLKNVVIVDIDEARKRVTPEG